MYFSDLKYAFQPKGPALVVPIVNIFYLQLYLLLSDLVIVVIFVVPSLLMLYFHYCCLLELNANTPFFFFKQKTGKKPKAEDINVTIPAVDTESVASMDSMSVPASPQSEVSIH